MTALEPQARAVGRSLSSGAGVGRETRHGTLLGYGCDGLGNLTSISDGVDSTCNRTLGYDALNRLSTAAGPWGSGTLTYDGAR